MAPSAGTSTFNLDYKKYEDNLVTGIVVVLLGLAYKATMKKEIVPVKGAGQILSTFLVTVISSIIGEELVDQLRAMGYIH